MSGFANTLYLAAFPPGLWVYHVRLGSAFPSDPHFVHTHNQAGGFLGSTEGRDIRGVDSVACCRLEDNRGTKEWRDLGKIISIRVRYWIGTGMLSNLLKLG